MTKYRFLIATAMVACIAFLPAATCTPQEAQTAKNVAKDALTLTQTLCIVANAFNPSVKSFCQVEDELAPAMNALLAQHKQGAVEYARQQLAAQHCSAPPLATDAGK